MQKDEPVSVKDHEAFAARHMPELSHDVEDFQDYRWSLTNWGKLPPKIASPEFNCGGYKWRILLFPFGNAKVPPKDTVSVYLECINPKTPDSWHACVQFALVISNPRDPTIFAVTHANHRFVPEESDWGFTRFKELRELFLIQEGFSGPVIENDCADVTAFVRVLRDPTGVLWHNFVNYDSKKATGYVGLKNQGATDYLDCVLQLYYCTNYLRKAVYQIPTEHRNPHESVALALQRIFYQLQTSDQPVITTELTKSFGWKSLDSFMAHDVGEFQEVLLHKLETLMKGTPANGSINKLFVGKMKSFIRCTNVNYEVSRLEDFNVLQLNVMGMRTLRDSFRDYVDIHYLNGQNRYTTEEFGLQDAEKGVIFESFPSVLHIQLKRFRYDVEGDAMVEVDNRHEYPFEIDLSEFLEQTVRHENWVYKLHGVFVHSGGIHGGHYVVLIKPGRDARWLKFDDDRVTPVTDREVLEDNYGGEPLTPNTVNPAIQQNQARKRFTIAYMLVYIRETAIDEVLSPVTEKDIPAHIKSGLDAEKSEQMKREREGQHLYLTVKITNDESFSQHQGFDLASFDDKNWPSSELPSFQALKTEPYVTFKRRVANHFAHSENAIRLWVLVNRQNKTIRPDVSVPEDEPSLTVDIVRNNMAARQTELRLYLEVGPEFGKATTNTVMIFLKHINVSKQCLLGVGKVYVQRTAKVGDLCPIINNKMDWTPETSLKLYEEIKPGTIEPMKPKATFIQSEIQNGDIICFQVEMSSKETQDVESQGLYSNPIQFYDFLQNRVLITFRPKYDEEQNLPELILILSKKMNYDIMAVKVGDALKHDPIKLRFTTTQPNGQPKLVIKRSLNQSISELMGPPYLTSPPTILYEKLDISIVELETKRSLKITWVDTYNKAGSTYPFLLPKTSQISDVSDQLRKVVKLKPGGMGRIRVFEIGNGGKAQKEYSNSEMIGNIPDSVELYAEEIPMEELRASGIDKVINVFHFRKDVSQTYGIPFKLVVKPGEKFADTKKRLQTRLRVPDQEFAKYRFTLIQDIDERDTLYDRKLLPLDALGLDHGV